MEREPDRYEGAWKDLHSRRSAFTWVLLSIFPVFLLARFLRSGGTAVWYLWFFTLVVVGTRIQFFRCPRCQYAFTHKLLWNPFTTKCLYCGLRMDERATTSSEER